MYSSISHINSFIISVTGKLPNLRNKISKNPTIGKNKQPDLYRFIPMGREYNFVTAVIITEVIKLNLFSQIFLKEKIIEISSVFLYSSSNGGLNGITIADEVANIAAAITPDKTFLSFIPFLLKIKI